MRQKLAAILLTLALACLGASAARAQSEGHVMLKPGDLKWTDVPALPGAKLAVMEGPLDQAAPITFRIKFPANYQIPAHSHPGIEHVTVISGTLNLGTGDKLDRAKTKAMTAGSFGIMPAKMNHFAWTKNETVVQIHGTGPWAINWVNPADAPKKK
ncbi:MAG TPA: cupin domain-containing protein [Candidatus Binatia bacterium]